ncbi:hypothetical protein [Natrinema thermotolerans]|uniref:hypothetical protein n=1 Tax=Natrinema thermotolerans TaxID=121872 RepID=UPI0006789910|nr:hypothetical protein [Natrinema thermotolerans]QCC57214.1 hypothetical protein DVR14_00645 [Natrinema thermotolerans]
MDSDERCAVCGRETTYHQQRINGSTLTRCRRHPPKRGRARQAATTLAVGVVMTVMPIVAAAHLFTDFSLGIAGSGLPMPYRPLADLWWVQTMLQLESWFITGLSAALLVCYGVGAAVFVYGKLRAEGATDG